MLSREICEHTGLNELWVVNPNNSSSETARMVRGFPKEMTLEEAVKVLDETLPDWHNPRKVSDEQIKSAIFPQKNLG